MEILKVENLCKTYGTGEAKVEALKQVSFSLCRGEFAAVVGESGSGKSTLLNCIGALDTPTSGHILMDGQDLFAMKDEQRTIFRRRNIGFIFQSFQLIPELNVEQNIAFPLLLDYRKPKKSEVDELLELLGLTERRRHLPSQLSGGQQQRVALARALAPAPAVLLLDEPFSALDAALRVELREEVRDLLRGIGTTAVLVTHDQAEALSLADHVAVMRAGRVVQAGAPAEVYARPVDPQTAAFLGESVELDCRVCGAVGGPELDLDCPLGRIRVDAHTVFPAGPTSDGPKTGESARLVLRPEQLELADGGVGGEVTAVGFFGHDALVRVTLTDGTPVAVRADGRRLPQVGDRIGVRVAQAPRQAPVAVV